MCEEATSKLKGGDGDYAVCAGCSKKPSEESDARINQLRAGRRQIMGKAYEVFAVSLKQRVRTPLPLKCPLHDLVRGQLTKVSSNADSFSF